MRWGVRGFESEKGAREMGKGMGVVTEEREIHGRYIVQLFCLESGQDMAKARSEMRATNREGGNRKFGDRPADHFSGSSLDLDRGWQNMAPWYHRPLRRSGRAGGEKTRVRKTRRCGKTVFETSKRGSDQRKADGGRRLRRE